MKKADIQIGEEYAAQVGYGAKRVHPNNPPDDLERVKVLEFDYREPMPKDHEGSSYIWNRDHPEGTRVKITKTRATRGRYVKGAEAVIDNRRLVMPWAEYVKARGESDIYEEWHRARNRADRACEEAIDQAWLTLLKRLDLPKDTYEDGDRRSFNPDRYGGPNAPDYIVLARAIADLRDGPEHARIAEAEEAVKQAREVRSDAVRLAVAHLFDSLEAAGFDLPDREGYDDVIADA